MGKSTKTVELKSKQLDKYLSILSASERKRIREETKAQEEIRWRKVIVPLSAKVEELNRKIRELNSYNKDLSRYIEKQNKLAWQFEKLYFDEDFNRALALLKESIATMDKAASDEKYKQFWSAVGRS